MPYTVQKLFHSYSLSKKKTLKCKETLADVQHNQQQMFFS